MWTKTLHLSLGLFLLLFTWLFSISGLVLNHSKWKFADFWSQRAESTSEQRVTLPAVGGDLVVARALMTQLHVVGEIDQVQRRPAENRIVVQITRPGRSVRIDASLDSSRATVKQTNVNAWGVMSALHHFTGVRVDDRARRPDWALTWLWSVSMDALAIGLVVLVVSGICLWYRLRAKRIPGLIAIGLGTIACAWFLFGLG
jgi:hypothetical protein